MTMIYIYDGTYEGFLSCLFRCITTRQWPDQIMVEQAARDDLFSCTAHTIVSDEESARKSLAWIGDTLGKYPLRHICRAFFSDLPGTEMCIMQYVQLGMQAGMDIDRYAADLRVRALHDLSGKVSAEIHRIHGLLRFQELADGICYARMSPDYDIIGFLPGYFSRRIGADRWIIHDEKRQKAVVYARGNWYITPIRRQRPLEFSQEETHFRLLWKRYFRDIALKERKNPKLQKNCMPRRYWRHLVEMEEDG